MSAAEQASTETVNTGPVIITVPGQDGHVLPVSEATVVEEAKPTEVEVKKVATGSEEQVDQENRDDKGRYKPGVQTRIDELTKARREAERNADYWKGRAEGAVVPEAKPAPAEVKQAPVREAYDTEDAFLDALTDHKVDVRLAQRDQQAKQAEAQTTKATDWQSKLSSARADIPDFDMVMDSAELPVASHVAESVMEHDQGAKVIHHLATNPAELDKINAMSPAKAAFAIAEIAGQFKPASSSELVAVVKTVKASEAPPPAARNVGSGRSTTVPLGEQSMEDYIATRKAQGASWAR